MVPFCCYCNYATIGQFGMRIFNFVVLFVITAPRNVSIPHIHVCVGLEAQLPLLQNLKSY